MGKDDAKRGFDGSERLAALTTARIKYLPPKQTVDFTTTDSSAPVYNGHRARPLNAEVTAEWDQ